MSRIDVIGVPMDLGAGRRGTDMGPSALRLTGLLDGLRELGHEAVDTGNVEVAMPETSEPGDPRQRYAEPIAATCRAVAARTRGSAATTACRWARSPAWRPRSASRAARWA